MWGSLRFHRVSGSCVFQYIASRSWIQEDCAHFEKALKTHSSHLYSGRCWVALLQDLNDDIIPLVIRDHCSSGRRYALLKHKQGNWCFLLDERSGRPFKSSLAGTDMRHFFAGTYDVVEKALPLYLSERPLWISSHNDIGLLHPGEGSLFTVNKAGVREGLTLIHFRSGARLSIESGVDEDLAYTVTLSDGFSFQDNRLFWPIPRYGLARWLPFLLLKGLRGGCTFNEASFVSPKI